MTPRVILFIICGQKPRSQDINAAYFRNIRANETSAAHNVSRAISHSLTQAVAAGDDLLSPCESITPHFIPRRQFTVAVPPVSSLEVICLKSRKFFMWPPFSLTGA